MKIRGYANPESAQLRPTADSDISTIEDIGPSVVHYYELTNTGPFDVGNVFVRRCNVILLFLFKYFLFPSWR